MVYRGPKKVPAARAAPTTDPNLPRPLAVGEYVTCALQPHPAIRNVVLAKVVALDPDYFQAAQEYCASLDLPQLDPHNSLPGTFASTVDLTASARAGSDLETRPPASKRARRSDSHAAFPDPGSAATSSSLFVVPSPSTPTAQTARKPDGLFDDKADDKAGTRPGTRPGTKSAAKHASSSEQKDGRSVADSLLDAASADREAVCPENPIRVGRVYLTFHHRDHRLDRWEDVVNVERAPPQASAPEEQLSENPYIRTRAMKRARDEVIPSADADIATEHRTAADQNEHHDAVTIVRNISQVVLGNYVTDAWYSSPFPSVTHKTDILFICGICLQYDISEAGHLAHRRCCQHVSPPGCLVYHDDENDIRVYEIDGLLNSTYCSCLCLVAKLFLEHKSLCYDIGAFNFYVVTVNRGEIAAYFSKEKPMTKSRYNVACILTFPQHQRKGIGRFLIDFSYELTRREGKLGTPERPLSDLGQLSYRRYWTHAIITFLRQQNGTSSKTVSVADISLGTAICESDIIPILRSLKLLHTWKCISSAKASKADLDMAQAKSAPPLIAVHTRYFRCRWAREFGKDTIPSASPRTSHAPRKLPNASKISLACTPREGGAIGTSNSATTKLGTSKSKKGKVKTGKIADRPDINLVQSSKQGVSKIGHSLKNGKKNESDAVEHAGFTDLQIRKMKDFIKLHSADAVIRKVESRFGVHEEVYHAFAISMALSYGKCRKKLRKMALMIINEPADIIPRKSSRNGEQKIVRGEIGESRQGKRNGIKPQQKRKEVIATATMIATVAPSPKNEGNTYVGGWYDMTENGEMQGQHVGFIGEGQGMDDYGVSGQDVMGFDSAYMGSNCDDVPKRIDRPKRVEFVEAKPRGDLEKNVVDDADRDDVVVID